MVYSCHQKEMAVLRWRRRRNTARIRKVARAGMGPGANRKPGSTQRRFNPSTFRQTERLPARTGPRLENGQATSLCRCESCTLLHKLFRARGYVPGRAHRVRADGPPRPPAPGPCRLSSTRQSAAVRRRRFQGRILGAMPTPGCSAEAAHLSDTEAAVVQLHPARPVPIVACPHSFRAYTLVDTMAARPCRFESCPLGRRGVAKWQPHCDVNHRPGDSHGPISIQCLSRALTTLAYTQPCQGSAGLTACTTKPGELARGRPRHLAYSHRGSLHTLSR